MKRTLVVVVAVVATLAFSTAGRANDKDKKDKDKDNKVVAEAVVVHFGQAQPQTPDVAPVGAAVTHFLTPNDLTIKKGQAVNFVVNGGGHGIAIHQVSKNTTRDNIAMDLCDGATPENPDPIVDRRNRFAVCNGTIDTKETVTAKVNGVDTIVKIIGTNNLDYTITDGKGEKVIVTGINAVIPAVPATPTTPAIPAIIVIDNPRVDDIQHSHRLLGTSGRAAGDKSPSGGLAAGAFLTGTGAPTAAVPTGTAGNRINVQFLKAGRYLVICMNRAHSLNDHMFGFVNVVGDDDDEN